MKSVSPDFEDHLLQENTTLATCWHLIRRDGIEFFFTDHDTNLVIDGDTYLASSGYMRTAIENDSTLSVDNLDINGFLDSDTITAQDLRAGKFDFATIYIFSVNWADLSMGILKQRRGWIGEVVLTDKGMFTSELRGMAQAFSQTIAQVYSPECRADLGDSQCKVPVQPPVILRTTTYAPGAFVRVVLDVGASGQAQYENRIFEVTTGGETDVVEPSAGYDSTVGNTTEDGTAILTARQAWSRDAVVTQVYDRSTFGIQVDESRAVDDWFNGGVVTFESGDNEGYVIEIRDSDVGEKASGQLVMTGQPADGQTFTVGAKTYTLQNALTNVDGHILIGPNVNATFANILAGVNLGAGAGVAYAASMTAHTTVNFSTGIGNRLELEAKTGGTAGNAIATTETMNNAAFDGTTLSGGNDNVITVFLPLPYDLAPGDTLRLYPGCDKRQETCIGKFNNIINMRAEPFVPGQDAILQYPDAH